MKKRAALLAMAAMLALTPVAAFAASDNNVNKTVDVKDDAILYGTSAPDLKIENGDGDWDPTETFELKLENADWLDEGSKDGNGVAIPALVDAGTSTNSFETAMENYIDTQSVTAGVYGITSQVERKSDSRIRVTLTGTHAGVNIAEDVIAKIPMWVEMDGDVAKVSIDSKDGTLTEETISFANGSDGDTTVSIEDTITFSGPKVMEEIEIKESANGSIDINELEYIEFELTDDFKYTAYGKVSGDFASDTIVARKKGATTAANAEYDGESVKVYFESATSTNTYPTGITPIVLTANTSGTGSFEFNGIEIDATNDGKEGEVKVKVKSNIDEIDTTTLVVGKYSEYEMEVKADGDALVIYNSQYEDVSDAGIRADTTDEAHELQKLIIDEDVEGTWDDGKEVLVKLPEGVKIIGVEWGEDKPATANDYSIDENELEFTINKPNSKNETEVTLFVSVKPGFTGDIEAVVSGRALDKEEFKAVLGKVEAPVEVKTEVVKLKAGVRNQDLNTITISETAPEMIKEGKIVLELKDNDMEWDKDDIEVDVVKGDLDIDEDDIEIEGDDDELLVITVNEESDEASVIEIKGAQVQLDRAVAEGDIEIEVKGDAIVRNAYNREFIQKELNKTTAQMDAFSKSDLTDDYGIFSADEYATIKVASVITPADDNTQGADEAKFVIGSSEYMVGEEVKVADVAPYIKDGRTMLSLKYVAEAVGVPNSNVIWNGEERSVTIMKGDRIAKVAIDSDILLVNGTPIKMDTAAEIKSGRTMLPVSFIGKALGAEIGWDGATKTVTIK